MYTEEQIQNRINHPYLKVVIDEKNKCKIWTAKEPWQYSKVPAMTSDEAIAFLKGVKTKPIVMMEMDYDTLAIRGTYVKKTQLYKMLENRKAVLGY